MFVLSPHPYKRRSRRVSSVWATRFATTNYLAFRFVSDKVAAGGYRRVKVLEFFDCPGPRQGVEDLRELLHKIDGNIVQKHGGSKQVGFKQLGVKQVGFKQLGPSVETGVHGVHDENVFGLRWNCREFKEIVKLRFFRVQGDHEAEVFQVSNNDTAVTQRRLEDKQPEEKTNTDCLVKEQEKEYQTGWKIKTGNVLDCFNQRSTQQCTKSGVAKQQQNGLVKETNVTLLAK
nr:hypothetical protein [Tanacetum cinerariifolium]